jgi:hypothetical protein
LKPPKTQPALLLVLPLLQPVLLTQQPALPALLPVPQRLPLAQPAMLPRRLLKRLPLR